MGMDRVWHEIFERLTNDHNVTLSQRMDIADIGPMPVPEEYTHADCLRWKSE
jgi:hypothetical protein